MLRAIVSLSALLLLSSCALGPDYLAPELELPEQYSEATNTELSAEQDFWWNSFEDEALKSLLIRAVEGNKDLAQALSRVNESRALAGIAFSQLLPGAVLNGSYLESKVSSARFPGPGGGNFGFEIYTGSIDASWEIDLFGRLRRELEARNAEFTAEVSDMRDVLRVLLSELVSSYLSLRSSQEQLRIAVKNSELQSESVELISARYNFGEAPELDLVRSKAQLAQTRAAIPALEAEVKSFAHRIAVLLGENPRSLYEELLNAFPGVPDYAGPVRIGAPADLLRDRPDVKLAERRLAAATARIGVAVAELFPQIAINGSLGVEAATFSLLNDNADTNSFGPSIRWAALDNGRLRRQIKANEAISEGALANYEGTVLRALEEVENSLVNYSADQASLLELKQSYESSKRAYDLAELQYQEGALDFLSLLDVQRTLLSAETQLSLGNERRLLSIVGIYRALGGGWQAWELTEQTLDPEGEQLEDAELRS